MVIGVSATAFLFWVRKGLKPRLLAMGMAPRMADIAHKAGPVAAGVVKTRASWAFDVAVRGVGIWGSVT